MCGAVRVLADELRVVPANFSRDPLRVREEIEVVDHHDLGRAARRQQQRMRREGDVETASGDDLYRRPLEAVPEQVEHCDRDSSVDDSNAGKSRQVFGQRSILPRTGNRSDVESRGVGGRRNVARPPECLALAEGAKTLEHEMTDARAATQRGTVIDDDSHGC